MIIIAHNIRSLHNVGAIFRNAAAFNVEKVYLTGITAAPPRKEIAKVALGAQDLVPWESADVGEIILNLRAQGYKIYGLETGEDAVDIRSLTPSNSPMAGGETEQIREKSAGTVKDCHPSSHGGVGGGYRLALVLGNEVEGIDQETLSQLDGKVMIPMGKKRSLNVSVASGIAMFVLQ